jgi:uridine kinase
MAALVRLCTTGSADMPIYDIAADGTVGIGRCRPPARH